MSEYDNSNIKIKQNAQFAWESAISLAEEFTKDVDWIQRGLEACERASVPHSYFVDKYLLKKDVPLHEGVQVAFIDIQRGR